MNRLRLASLALLAGAGLLQGCASPDCCNGGGGLLQRLGLGRRGHCDCTPVCNGCNGQGIIEGNGHTLDGPLLEPQAPGLPPSVGTEPPIAPVPRPYQAQPMPAGPVSKLRVIDAGQK
jgi:hypothetical protein